eukprot:Seg42.4 transcript_id=Seg42.4/GoldUCD/mRNA.D3Y31 product="hypothetical protein" protein_id=Seg42.4/GoldUCD/D3Y31
MCDPRPLQTKVRNLGGNFSYQCQKVCTILKMTDIQLRRDKTGSLPFLSRWSTVEVAHPSRDLGNSDHWSKMKHKSVEFAVCGTNGKAHIFPGDALQYERKDSKKLLAYRHDVDGSMRHIGIKTFSEWIVQELNGNVPGDYRKTRATSARLLRTPANDRAREGFRYWYLEKKPSTYSQWMGTKGNTLGLAG